MANDDSITLGLSDIHIRPCGIGGWAWGDRLLWGYGRSYNDRDIHEAIVTSLMKGITLIDTAESYGTGRSEEIIGNIIKELGSQVVIATKFMPYPWRISRSTLMKALRNSLKRLGLDRLDLYQIHMPFPPMPTKFWAEALVEALESGLTRTVGVSNYNKDLMLETQEILMRRGYFLASNQIRYHLVNRKAEREGLLSACHDAKITFIAYSPLAQGVLTGKYSPEHQLSGIRGSVYSKELLTRISPLLREMREIGRAHENKTHAQVALNWLICKGTLPIPGAKNARQAMDNANALGWRLTEEEIAVLDVISTRVMKQ